MELLHIPKIQLDRIDGSVTLLFHRGLVVVEVLLSPLLDLRKTMLLVQHPLFGLFRLLFVSLPLQLSLELLRRLVSALGCFTRLFLVRLLVIASREELDIAHHPLRHVWILLVPRRLASVQMVRGRVELPPILLLPRRLEELLEGVLRKSGVWVILVLEDLN